MELIICVGELESRNYSKNAEYSVIRAYNNFLRGNFIKCEKLVKV